MFHSVDSNEDAKRLFDDIMSGYNRLKRPVDKPNKVLTIKLKLRLSQIIDVVASTFLPDFVFRSVTVLKTFVARKRSDYDDQRLVETRMGRLQTEMGTRQVR